MKEEQLNQWIDAFEKEVGTIEIEFNAFFKDKKLRDYYSLHISKSTGNLSVEINQRDELPPEIIDRLTAAYLTAKPR